MEKDFDNNQGNIPLVVDMDGTLIKTDMLYESANNFIIRYPLSLMHLITWLRNGKTHLKAQLAEKSLIDVTLLPYNLNLISLLKQQKLLGRVIVLATASHRFLAEAIAKHLGFFDEVIATEDKMNLRSESKRDVLVARFGERGFDYVGNDKADLPVWKSAQRSYIVSNSPRLINEVRKLGNLTEVITNEKPSLTHILQKTLRVHQWVKNLLIFIPALAAHLFYSLDHIIVLSLAFVVFCLTASSVYILNDLVDVANDRHHIRKRHRPFAAGNLSLLTGWLLWPSLLIVALVIAGLTLPGFFSAVLLFYFTLTLAYSFRLKQTAILDVITLAVLYTIRIIAGSAAITTPLSFWLLSLSVFIFLSLAFVKRYSELHLACKAGRHAQVKGRGYAQEDLLLISTMGVGAGYLAVLVLALYVQDPHTAELYNHPKTIWFACPLLLYWISRVWLITNRGQMDDDPIIFAIKDRISWVIGACFLAVFLFAMVQ